jgi:cell division protein FtsQ
MIKNNGAYRKVKHGLIWGSVLLGFIVLTYFSIQRKEKQTIENLNIKIESPENQKALVSKDEVRKLFEGYLGYDPLLAEVKELNLDELEALLINDGRLEKVEVFLDANNDLCVNLFEKKVVVRVLKKELSYYLDERGGRVPTVKNKAIRVPIATGDIEEYSRELLDSKLQSNLKDIWTLSKAIESDPFLNALIEQIDIDNKGMITMIPKIGREKIMLSGSEIEDKLTNLKIFYKEGLPREGWSKYASINLDIKGQIVAERLENH